MMEQGKNRNGPLHNYILWDFAHYPTASSRIYLALETVIE